MRGGLGLGVAALLCGVLVVAIVLCVETPSRSEAGKPPSEHAVAPANEPLTATPPVRVPRQADGAVARPDRVRAAAEPLSEGARQTPRESAGVIEGRVTDATGAPVADAQVTWILRARAGASPNLVLSNQIASQSQATSGADGGFRLERVTPGVVDVDVARPPFLPGRAAGVSVVDGSTSRADVSLGRGLSITGRAKRPDGKLIERLWIEVRTEPDDVEAGTVKVETDGSFRVDCLVPGSYRLVGHSGKVRPSEAVVVAAGATGVELPVAASTAISGIVRFKDGRPVARVGVWAHLQIRVGSYRLWTSETREDGTFVVDGIEPGEYELSVHESRNEPVGKPKINMRPAQRSDVAAGSEGVVIEVEPGLTISGRVFGPDGLPVVSGQVACRTWQQRGTELVPSVEFLIRRWSSVTATADVHDGKFELSCLEEGQYVVSARTGGLATTSVRADAGTKDVVFRLVEGGTIKGRVLLPDGGPAHDATVEVDAELVSSLGDQTVTTDADGRFTIGGVAPGACQVIAIRRDPDQFDSALVGRATDVLVVSGRTVEGIEIRLSTSK